MSEFEASAYVYEVARRVRGALADGLAGVWLCGSAALEDFDPARSDIDVQAVSAMRVSLAERERLVASLSHEALPCPARGLEFVLYAREQLHDPAGPAYQLNLNTGERMERHVAFDATADPRFWFTIDVSIARERSVPLIGPPAARVLPDLPVRVIVGALHDALDWYAGVDGSPAQTVLSACRTWSWAVDGQWRSKGESARWAIARLADPSPVEAALRLRDGRSAEPPTPAQVGTLVAAARAALNVR